MSAKVVLVDDEEHMRAACLQAFELAGIPAAGFESAALAVAEIGSNWHGVVITDVKMPGMTGLELMACAHDVDADLPVIVITGHGDVAMAVQAMRDGAYDFIEKPFASELLVDAARRALETRRLVLENRALKAELQNGNALERTLVGHSTAMQQLKGRITGYAASDADVLILGETGTGKEIVARALHELSPRGAARFVAINCGSLPETIIESELFGHEAGAFTGATGRRTGRFEYADGGTLFLDEIESMPLDLQPRLLRVLEERRITPLGSNEEIALDLRVIAATKEDLRAAAAKGAFREDVYYRLNVLCLRIPPLRERRQDIPLLFQHFVSESARRLHRDTCDPAAEEMALLLGHGWPGNVRELKNAAMRFAMGLGMDLSTEPAVAAGAGQTDCRRTLAEQMAATERQIIRQALTANDNRLKETYEALGISRKTLYDKMQKYGLSTSGRSAG